jgi:hypothetical protein
LHRDGLTDTLKNADIHKISPLGSSVIDGLGAERPIKAREKDDREDVTVLFTAFK